MSYSYSKYHLNKNSYTNSRSYQARPRHHAPELYETISPTQNCNIPPQDLRNMNIRAPTVYINPNSLGMSRSVHVNKSKFSINQNSQSVTPFLDPRMNAPLSDNKIYYNPKFLKSTQNSMCSSTTTALNPKDVSVGKTIHINPSFAKNVAVNRKLESVSADCSNYNANYFPSEHNNEHSLESLNKCSTDFVLENNSVNSTECIYINPKFVEASDYRQSVQNAYSENADQFSLPYNLTSNLNSDQTVTSTTFVQSRCSLASFNSKYRKVNQVSSFIPKTSKVSVYKIHRNNICKNTLTNPQPSPSKNVSFRHVKIPVRKPRLSGSFKKIGKRKLVRKSLIQNYILSRRQSLPSMIQHSRNTLASRRKLKLISKTKYKLIRGDILSVKKVSPSSKLPNFKNGHIIPSKSKLKWSRTDNNVSHRSQDFIKISQSKIVRKSVLQSILEARRNSLYNFRKFSPNKKVHLLKNKDKLNLKTVKSRFKVVRNNASAQNQIHQSNTSLHCRKGSNSFSTNKKIGPCNITNVLKSKSILYRMPPSLRFKIKLEEKRKRMMLLKKVNNRKKCLYYNRFGYCKGLEEGSCKKLHDPRSIAVCRKHLKGLCDGEGCKLSHHVVPEKMPTCHQFLAGVCVRPSCPFLHVKLSGDQPICIDFLQGFCQHGDMCTKRHQFICPDWAEKGSCKSEKCSYPHPVTGTKKKQRLKFNPSRISHREEDTNETDVSNIIKNPNDDMKNRYFSVNSENKECGEKVENENLSIVERKPEMNDGINSVYKDESLLSFIPFS